jgi:hypothetical protein
VTLKRIGKNKVNFKGSKESGDPRFTWIIAILSVQTVLLAIVLLVEFDLFSSDKKEAVPYPEDYFAEADTSSAIPDTQIVMEQQVSPTEQPAPIRVEVLNGCGKVGLAKKVADFLRGKGYDVRDFRSAPNFNYKQTQIVVRSSKIEHGQSLAGTISFPKELVKSQKDTTLADIDVTLILGKDYRRYVLPQ